MGEGLRGLEVERLRGLEVEGFRRNQEGTGEFLTNK
jgi:hypothetical protein